MSAQLFFFAIDVATAFAAVVLGLRVMTQRPLLPAAQIMAMIAFNAVCDVTLGRSDYSFWVPGPLQVHVTGALAVVFNLARNSTPFLFAAFSFVVFADQRRFPRWLYALLAVQLFLEEPVHLLIAPSAPYAQLVTQAAPALLQTFFVAVALYWIAADWRADLIETRRRTRFLISIAIGVDLIFSGLVPRVLIDPDTVANYYTHVALTFSHLVLLLFVLFQLMDSGIDTYLDPLRSPVPQPPPANPDTAALARLAALMEQEHLYRRPGLTLAALAEKAALPEYRLRRLIHEQLGFANFNAFLHAWRIREACEQFRDPTQRRTPILTIALSVGYQSVNTFNRGFRDVMGTTPSAWRGDEAAPLPPRPEVGTPKTA
ncbi:MAG: helix-turn-helix domain-containing protein [Alphaproteobacteria bacterium]|nr:helix-turn-helix domain-containing protein [Alphaproteobacteria bacterium]MBV9905375.1 helix-turn-helix domain-containing protein [Alphaproteobacteria bacterium]